MLKIIQILVLLLVVIQFCLEVVKSEALKNFDKDFSRPVTGKVYFGIAIPNSGHSFSKAFNKTLVNLTQNYLSGHLKKIAYNISLETLVIELPEKGGFSSTLLERLCDSFEKKQVVAVLVVGATPAAFTVTWAARHAGIPVLWARGQSEFLPGFRGLENSPLEVHLAPTGRELVQALRGLLLQAHWHTFTVLADTSSATALRSPELWNVLQATPLHPTLVHLPNPLRPQSIFRKLADISRSTRGVVILCSDRSSAIRILDDAKRLNMMDGHFVWIWIDTASSLNIANVSEELIEKSKRHRTSETKSRPTIEDDDYSQYVDDEHDESRELDTRERRSVLLQRDLNNMRLSYFLKNDHYLLLNRNEYGVESSKFRESKSTEDSRSRTVFSKLFGARTEKKSDLPAGLLSIKPLPIKIDRNLVKGAVKLLTTTLLSVVSRSPAGLLLNISRNKLITSCWQRENERNLNFSKDYSGELKLACTEALSGKKITQEIGVDKVDKSLVANFEILNLVPENSFSNKTSENSERLYKYTSPLKWKRVGLVSGRNVRLDTIIWPGGDLSVAAVSIRARTVFRVVTSIEPPFVMESELDEDGQCLRGLPCHRVLTSDKDNLTLVFNEMKRIEEEKDDEETVQEHNNNFLNDYTQFTSDYSDDDERFFPFQKFKYKTNCCYGLSMDLLENIAQELEFDFRLYIVADGRFGSRVMTKKENQSREKRDVGKKYLSYRFKEEINKGKRIKDEKIEFNTKWNGIVGDLVSGAAHMSFAALSVSSARSEVIDFSVPYFFSGVSFLAAPQQRSEIPLMAFLLPFSMELWIAIFTSLNITAIAVAIYEWLSPFGLNPWGRQRSKNFSMSSALWVMWGLLCGHLVAFKAPKSWPNKFLINVWGGFSVIFVASYTANIAALIAGLFFHNTVSNYHDRSLLSQRVGSPKSSAAEYYVQKANQLLWRHMSKYSLENVEDGVKRLKNGSLDILIADTPILDYYRATDHGCKLQKIGDIINEDTYAIGMAKGFPLKDSISAVIAKYSSNGYMDILQEKWYGGLPCFKLSMDIAQPRPLGVAAVTGVFILLGVGMVMGLVILFVEHLFFRYTLPLLRDKPKGSVWKSRNIMFFSQKLYRFINCVELVSPQHAARELVHTIRQGQITSLFQKSIKRKEHEQRRRRKSKAQFFEMIQEIRSNMRRQQQQEQSNAQLESVREVDSEQLSPEDKKNKLSPSIIRRTFLRHSPKGDNSKSPTGLFNKQLFSPRSKNKTKSSTSLNVRRFSTDSVFNSPTIIMKDPSASIGRRLSKDASQFLENSPPDINSRRSSYLDVISQGSKLSGKSPVLSIENISDCGSAKSTEFPRKLSDSECIGRKLASLPVQGSIDKHRLQPQYSLTIGKSDEALSSGEKLEKGVSIAKSFNSIDKLDHKSNLPDEEMGKRNRETINHLQTQLSQGKSKTLNNNDNNAKNTHKPNPQIRIELTEEESDQSKKKNKEHNAEKRKNPPLSKTKNKSATRHRSLGEASQVNNPSSSVDTASKKNKLQEPSKSLDSSAPKRSRSRSRSRHFEDDLPPAPPPPNCSPRNSDGKSPLERLSKDELVRLWRSSESELRSHLLKAIRDKEEPTDPT